MVTTLGRILDAMSAMDPLARTDEPTGAGGNDTSPPAARLIRNAPAMPPKRAATMAIASPPATIAVIAPAPRLRRPCEPWCSEECGVTGEAAKVGPSGGGLGCRKGLPV